MTHSPQFAYLFLSRLCGGEQGISKVVSKLGFLSRLCGGELFTSENRKRNVFLSRLCGGELIVH